MAWSYRSPSLFSMVYPETLRRAAASPETFTLFETCKSQTSAKAAAESFSFYRWCLRQQPEAHRALSTLEESFQFRAKLFHDQPSNSWLVYIKASPTRYGELLSLNPHLAELLS